MDSLNQESPLLLGRRASKNGKYSLEQEVGRGSFGVIYQAIDRVLEQQVALEMLDLSLKQHPKLVDFVHQFRDEAIGLAKCSHTNIVQVRDFFVEKELPFSIHY